MYTTNIYRCHLVKDRTVRYGHASCPKNIFEIMTELGADSWAEECLYLFCLDIRNRVIGIHEISHGTIVSTSADVKDIFKRALLNNATSIILAHNHPSGCVSPSKEDIAITRRVTEAGNLLEVTLLDHVIIGDGQFCSLQEQNLI